ncbi:hypothetical protein CRG98_002215 [Punica granatum]|uniref:Uncharacterized protein n=1 Tax=Punica granatum TaxID=22663 RepID=A0A2I0L9L1_PUNGR|nr:hypothetical protein CRG98_002215 [Punica granatum]
MQSPYGIRMIRIQRRWACQTNDRTARASSGKSRYAHAWLTGVLGGLVSRPPRTGPTCTVKAKFFMGQLGTTSQELLQTLIPSHTGYVGAPSLELESRRTRCRILANFQQVKARLPKPVKLVFSKA